MRPEKYSMFSPARIRYTVTINKTHLVCRQKGEMGYEKKNFISDNGGVALSFAGCMRGGN